MSLRRSLSLLLPALLVMVGPSARAADLITPATLGDKTKAPDPNKSVFIEWKSYDDLKKKKPPEVQSLAAQPTAFGPNSRKEDNNSKSIEEEDDPQTPGTKRLKVAESQEGLSGGNNFPGANQENMPDLMAVKYRVYTFPAPVDESLYTDYKPVKEFSTPAAGETSDSVKNEVKVDYEWSVKNRVPACHDGTYEFKNTASDLKAAHELNPGAGLDTALGNSCWLPFAEKLDASGNPQNAAPQPFGNLAMAARLSEGQRVPNFSYTAGRPTNVDIFFKMKVTKNNGSGGDGPVVADNNAAPLKKSLNVENMTPPMLLTGNAPGPVFSTTGDLLDDDGKNTPGFRQDDKFTVIWVMSNAHSGAAVDPDTAPHVSALKVLYPEFVKPGDKPDTALMPPADQDLSVDPVTGEIKGTNVYSGGDFFGLGNVGAGENKLGATEMLKGDATKEIPNAPKDSMGVSAQFAPRMTASVSKPDLTMDDFAKGTYQDKKLTQDIIDSTPGKEGLVATIQLPSNFPMPECQMAMLSAFKVKVPIERAPMNFEGKVPWVVSAEVDSKKAGEMAGSLSVIDNKPPDLTVAIQNPKAGTTKILQVQNTSGAPRTLDPEPFSIRKGDMAVSDVPTNPKDPQTVTPTTPPPGATPTPIQTQTVFPDQNAFKDKANITVTPEGVADVIQLPDQFGALKGAVLEVLEIPKDTVPADEDVRLTVQLFPTDNVSTWDELYVKIFTEESFSEGGADAKPSFEGTMTKFKTEQGGRFVSNARTTTDKQESKMRVEVYDFDPAKVPYKGPSLNPKANGKPTIRLFANCRTIIIPVQRGGVAMEMREIQSESQKGNN